MTMMHCPLGLCGWIVVTCTGRLRYSYAGIDIVTIALAWGTSPCAVMTFISLFTVVVSVCEMICHRQRIYFYTWYGRSPQQQWHETPWGLVWDTYGRSVTCLGLVYYWSTRCILMSYFHCNWSTSCVPSVCSMAWWTKLAIILQPPALGLLPACHCCRLTTAPPPTIVDLQLVRNVVMSAPFRFVFFVVSRCAAASCV